MSKELKNNILQENCKHAFTDIPDGYFESIHGKIMERIDRQNTKEISYFGHKIAAISIILIVAAGLLYLMFNSNTPNHQQFALSNRILPDTIRNTETKIKPIILKDSTIADYKNAENLISDTLSFDNLSDEEILQYLLESEEFEF
jgi:hypothetical protein